MWPKRNKLCWIYPEISYTFYPFTIHTYTHIHAHTYISFSSGPLQYNACLWGVEQADLIGRTKQCRHQRYPSYIYQNSSSIIPFILWNFLPVTLFSSLSKHFLDKYHANNRRGCPSFQFSTGTRTKIVPLDNSITHFDYYATLFQNMFTSSLRIRFSRSYSFSFLFFLFLFFIYTFTYCISIWKITSVFIRLHYNKLIRNIVISFRADNCGFTFMQTSQEILWYSSIRL